jgi:hypothetical protein
VSILSDFEDRVGGALEGAFAGMFRSPVQPVEIAKALGRAMDDGRTIGVGRVYAPLAYTVALSPEDAAKYGSFTTTLAGELATYLTGQARERNYQLTAPPKVSFIVHDDLRLGRFRVSAELGAPEAGIEAVAASVAAPADVESWPEGPRSPSDDLATVTVGDHEHDVLLRGERVLVGRLAACAIRLADANVSREHAAFVPVGNGWAIEDLGSTNGTLLNGEPVARALLHDGDVIEIGLTRLTFHESGR